MTRHPSEEALLLWVEGGASLDPSMELHLKSCADCATKVEDVRELVQTLRRAGMREVPDPLAGTLDSRYADSLRGAIYPNRRRPLRFPMVAAAAAACILIWLAAHWSQDNEETSEEVRLRMGYLIAEGSADVLRGAKERTVHFQFQLPRPTYLIILRVADEGLSILYPHPNAVLGTFGQDGPLPAGTNLRIPPSPIVDYVALPGEETAEYWAFFLNALPTAGERREIVEAANALISAGRTAARELLDAKWGTPSVVPAWR